jgi:hypothetical protein
MQHICAARAPAPQYIKIHTKQFIAVGRATFIADRGVAGRDIATRLYRGITTKQ